MANKNSAAMNVSPTRDLWNLLYDDANSNYRTKLPYPKKPETPAVLKKSAGELTDSEFETLLRVRRDWDEQKKAYEMARSAYSEDTGRLELQFQIDLAEFHGMTGHPKESALFRLAWQYGHGAGLGDVVSHYDDLVELLK